jgi:hypothetical protein
MIEPYSTVPPRRPLRSTIILGWTLTILPALVLAASASGKLVGAAPVKEMMGGKLGYSPGTIVMVGAVELACALLFVIPPTSVLGAILVTGYLGGAVATHVRAGDAFIAPLLLGVVAWGGLFLRDERLRALLPFRR